jgi:hypothetical protein
VAREVGPDGEILKEERLIRRRDRLREGSENRPRQEGGRETGGGEVILEISAPRRVPDAEGSEGWEGAKAAVIAEGKVDVRTHRNPSGASRGTSLGNENCAL